jgi:uncharacterized protein (DUF486 family)
MYTVVLLICSNVFMTLAWYGHVWLWHDRPKPLLWVTILVCWFVALPEYALQVPANREGAKTFTVAQLKILQEVIAIAIFLVLNVAVGRTWPRWNEWAAFALIAAAVFVARWNDVKAAPNEVTSSPRQAVS